MDNYDRARTLLTENREALLRIADELLAREVLDAEQVQRLAEGLPLDDVADTPPAATPQKEPSERPGIVPSLGKTVPQE